jgi:hypothetical protein
MLRRLRSVLTIGALWGTVWLLIGLLLGWPARWFDGSSLERSAIVLAVWTALGGLSGLGFASMLAWLERGHTVDTLRSSRVALWGIVSGVALPVSLCVALVLALPDSYLTLASGGMFAVMGAVGAVSAVATLRLAKKSHDVAVEPGGVTR